MFSGGRGEEVFQKQERAGAEANTQMRGVTNIPALGRWPVKAVMGGCGVLFRDTVGTGGGSQLATRQVLYRYTVAAGAASTRGG